MVYELAENQSIAGLSEEIWGFDREREMSAG
jgi:hypothetical protein